MDCSSTSVELIWFQNVTHTHTRRITASDWLEGVCNDHVTTRLRLCGPVTFLDSMLVAEGLMCQPLFRCNGALTLWNIQKVRREQDRTLFTARIHIYVRTPPAVQEGKRRKLLARCVESRRCRLSTFFFSARPPLLLIGCTTFSVRQRNRRL